ncbi:MAG: hypothetical protein JSU08_13280 [Acidobacteria bacterium]|nr:hypothetical protein [Acidobacteriota bacterium]
MRVRLVSRLLWGALAALIIGSAFPTGRVVIRAQEAQGLSGTWTIDRENSQFPREVGFDADFVPTGRPDGDRGRRGVVGGALPALRPQGESYDAAQRRQVLTDEVRNPPSRLTIVEAPDAVTFTDQQGNSRTIHPDGRAETIQVGSVPVLVTARREGAALIVLYAVADLRQIRYSYAREPGSDALVVDTQFLERGSGDTVRRVYALGDGAATRPAAAADSRPGAVGPQSGPTAPAAPAVPRAGSEFRGLTRMGIVVEEPSTQAANCGVRRDALEAAVAKHFTGIGLKTSTNSDEDTYVHVTVMTSTLPSGMCISRYDWFIYSMADATLSYQRSPLLAQVVLAHRGGLTGSLPATHAADIIRGMDDGLAQIATIIQNANR